MAFCLKRITCILSWFTVRGARGKCSAWCATLLRLSQWININRQKLHVSRLSSLMLHLTAVEWSRKLWRQARNCEDKKSFSHITAVWCCSPQYRGQAFSLDLVKVAWCLAVCVLSSDWLRDRRPVSVSPAPCLLFRMHSVVKFKSLSDRQQCDSGNFCKFSPWQNPQCWRNFVHHQRHLASQPKGRGGWG